MTFFSQFAAKKPLIAMIHLPALPGYKDCPGMDQLMRHVEEEVCLLEELGFDGVLIENEYDQPHNVLSKPETTAAMAVLTHIGVAAAKKIVVGSEILLNDPCASMAAAKAGRASFIRTDYFVDRMERPEYGGEMAIDPEGLLQYRRSIAAGPIMIFADIQVKYAKMIAPRPIGASAIEAKEKGADAVIVSGTVTGDSPVQTDLAAVAAAVPGFPVLIGSGLNAANAHLLLPLVSGAIVGTGIMSHGRIDRRKAEDLLAIRASL